MAHKMSKDEVVLLKSNNIDLGNDKYMMIIYYYHAEKGNRANSFYKCSIRIDTKENWVNLRNSILKDNPAEHFRNSMIGLDDDFKFFYSRHTFTKADMYKWLGTKFSKTKITTLDKFLEEEFQPNILEPFLRKYSVEGIETDISEISKFKNGIWYSALKPKKQRKSYGKIIY